MHENPALFKRSGIVIATFVGGSLATAYLIRRNMLDAGRPKEASEATVIFGSLGAAFLMVNSPQDLISLLLYIAIPQLLLVLAVLRFTRYGDFSEHALSSGALRSNWQAFAVGVAANLLLKGLFYCTSLLWI